MDRPNQALHFIGSYAPKSEGARSAKNEEHRHILSSGWHSMAVLSTERMAEIRESCKKKKNPVLATTSRLLKS